MSISEAMLHREWAKLEKKAKNINNKPPDVSIETESFDDLYEWGAWVAKKGNITPEGSRELLQGLREYLHSK